MPIKRGESITDIFEEEEEQKSEDKSRKKKELLDTFLSDIEELSKKPEPVKQAEPTEQAETAKPTEPIQEIQPVQPIQPDKTTEEKHEELLKVESNVKRKGKTPRATGRLANKDLDFKNMSTGLLSEIAGRDLVSGDKYKKSKKRMWTAILLVVLVSALGAGYFGYTQYYRSSKDDELVLLQAQKEEAEKRLKEYEGSEKYLKSELDKYMKNKDYTRALQVVNRITSEYKDSETAKYAEEKGKTARKALEKMGIPESKDNEDLAVDYEDYKPVSYDKLAVNSKDYRGNKVKVYGKILQMEDGKDKKITVVRLAVDDDMTKQLVAQYEKSKSINVEEGDYVNIGGLVVPDLTFKTAVGKTTLPAMSAVYVDKILS